MRSTEQSSTVLTLTVSPTAQTPVPRPTSLDGLRRTGFQSVLDRMKCRTGLLHVLDRMQSCPTLQINVVWILGLLGGLAVAQAANSTEPHRADPPHTDVVRFGVIPSSMPRSGLSSSGDARGTDVEVARLIARELGRRLELNWCQSDTCRWRKLRAREIDIVVGVPHQSVESSDVAWTAPYAAGQFGLVVPREAKGVRSLRDLQGKRVGIVTGTVPVDTSRHTVVRFPSRHALIASFQSAKLDAALLDVDFTAWHLKEYPTATLRLVPEFVPQQRWSIGMAVRADDEALRTQIDQAVRTCLQKAKFVPLFADYGLVHRAPLVKKPQAQAEVAEESWPRIQSTGKLTVSMDPANLPFSSAPNEIADAERPGFDVELARALAKQLQVDIELKWIDVHRETAIGELLDHQCDVAFGAAVDPNAMDDEEELSGKVIYSRPYYGTGYLLVARKDGPQIKSLKEIQGRASRRLGTQAGTVADYELRQRGYLRRLFGTQLAVLKAVSDGDIDYGYLWANVGWMLHHSPDLNARLIPGYVPQDRWNFAVAMRKGDVTLKRHIDAGLQNLTQTGVVAETLGRYHVPYFEPFKSATDAGSEQLDAGFAQLDAGVANGSDEVATRKPVDRGLEPQMQRRQRSRASYGGLEKVRARGTLVVGLDQNNLPLSSAHPKPSGLDYEIAELIAARLDVVLDIYWAYSSHDSYPSKLANKYFCDVMLGVMPDDRFSKRVIYTNPYYYAGYQLVVAAGVDSVNDETSTDIAIEPGIAIRGLAGRGVKQYPDLHTILESVANGQAQAGYVIATKGQWLAAQKWPGQLQFQESRTTADRFPICAAVRRTEPDLKDTIENVLQQLHVSGQLAEVFARWNVPYDTRQLDEK
jgi:polar amino acid transport system substrate-binding protein